MLIVRRCKTPNNRYPSMAEMMCPTEAERYDSFAYTAISNHSLTPTDTQTTDDVEAFARRLGTEAVYRFTGKELYAASQREERFASLAPVGAAFAKTHVFIFFNMEPAPAPA